jgi:hypothetical protein
VDQSVAAAAQRRRPRRAVQIAPAWPSLSPPWRTDEEIGERRSGQSDGATHGTMTDGLGESWRGRWRGGRGLA